MGAEVLLEVEDRERITLVEREELAEGGVGLDRLLVHEVVGARIRHDALGDRRAADLRVLGVGEEAAELVADADGLREDARLGLGTLDGLRLALAAAVGLLDDAAGLLLDDLEGRRGGRRSRLEGAELVVELRNRLVERGTDVLLNDGVRGRGRNDGRGDDHRGLDDGLDGLGLRGLYGGGSDGLCNNGCSNGCDNLGLLCGLRRLRGLGGGAHFDVVRGTNCGHLTRVLHRGCGHTAVKFGRQTIKVAIP